MPLQALTTTPAPCSICGVPGMALSTGDAVSNGLCSLCQAAGNPFIFTPTRTPVTRRNRQQKRASVRQENRIARDVDGRRQKASGATAHAKGDVRKAGSLRIEAKYTTAKSFSLKLADLVKIRSECTGRETPAFQITFMDRERRPIDEWMAVPYSVWRRLYAAAEDS